MPDWVRRVWRWMRSFFKTEHESKEPKILRHYNREADPDKGILESECAVLAIRRKTKGAIATYRIVPKQRGTHYLITLDDLKAQERVELGTFKGVPIVIRDVDPKTDPDHTHGFCIWEIREGRGPQLLEAWHIRLMPTGRSAARQELAPEAIALNTALRLMKIPATPFMSWSEQVAEMNWIGLLESVARVHLGNPRYNLRARRVQN